MSTLVNRPHDRVPCANAPLCKRSCARPYRYCIACKERAITQLEESGYLEKPVLESHKRSKDASEDRLGTRGRGDS